MNLKDYFIYCVRIIWNKLVPSKIKEKLQIGKKMGIVSIENSHLKKAILETYQDTDDPDIIEICSFIKKKGEVQAINYFYTEKYENVSFDILWDDDYKGYYVFFESKKIYMKKTFTKSECIQYFTSILIEQDAQSPHCYYNEKICYADGNVIFDIGSAEGFYVIELMNKSHINLMFYLFECDDEWLEALRCTFSEYANVHIVPAYVGALSKDSSVVSIDDFVKINQVIPSVIKMDIEGAEREAILGAKDTLDKHEVQLIICVYHRNDDLDYFKALFVNKSTEVNKRYMIWNNDENYEHPYIRRGVLFVK